MEAAWAECTSRERRISWPPPVIPGGGFFFAGQFRTGAAPKVSRETEWRSKGASGGDPAGSASVADGGSREAGEGVANGNVLGYLDVEASLGDLGIDPYVAKRQDRRISVCLQVFELSRKVGLLVNPEPDDLESVFNSSPL